MVLRLLGFFASVGVPSHKFNTFNYPNAPALSPTSRCLKPTANYLNNVSKYQGYSFHHNKTWQMNNNLQE